jgi:hypothetical protein
MANLILHDAMSVLRVGLETSVGGRYFRELFQHQLNSHDVNIWVWDGKGNTQTRRDIYPGYKSNRQPASNHIYRGMDIIRQLLTHAGVMQVQIDGFEADDVIAKLALTHHKLFDKVLIQTTDKDLQQIETFGSNILCMARFKDEYGVASSDVHLYKTLVGDPSDTVKGVKGFGHKGWLKCDREAMRLLVANIITGTVAPVEDWITAGMTRSSAQWVYDNPGEVVACWKVTGFMMPDQVELTAGEANEASGMSIIRKFHL